MRWIPAVIAACALLAVPLAGQTAKSARASVGRSPLFAGGYGENLANRVAYGMDNNGEIGSDQCCDFQNSGFWPRGTSNQYLWNSGLQLSGIIGGSRPTNPWAGDTSAGFFFDASGLRQHGTGVTSVYNALVPADLAEWPQAGFVPVGGPGAESFAATLRNRASVSDGDVWWLSWEGDPGLNAARPHPLGVVAEYRVMGWNAPRGNEDILYVLVTFYNITARTPSAYAGYRPGLREVLVAQAEQFHQLNEAAFAVDLPDAGYPIAPFHAAVVADPDVTFQAGSNFTSVNQPLAMGMNWHADFPRASGWSFPVDIFGPPFFSGAGLLGIKFLETLDGSNTIQLYSQFSSGGAFPSPNTAARAFKYLSGTITPADGISCNQGDPLVSHICFINDVTPSDVRGMMSSPPTTLPPGGSATIAFAYVHAAPVALPGLPGRRVTPGSPRRMADAAQLALGANTIDSVAGFTGWTDRNGDGVVQGGEFTAVRGSLIRKAQLAQAIFDHRFQTPMAPEAPEFFLVPGDNAVTVVWRPSSAEATGDPYFAVASQALTTPIGGGVPLPNPLYDPNYRQFDVEGYRIYRGRVDSPASLALVAQYDYANTVFRDYTGQTAGQWQQPLGTACAPELGITTSCPDRFDTPGPGVQLTRYVETPIAGAFVQVALGDRVVFPGGDLFVLRADSAAGGGGSSTPPFGDSGVPFSYVDRDVRNDLTYFYAVTTFDVNAIESTGPGRTSLESPRVTRRVMPRRTAPRAADSVATAIRLVGRGGELTDDAMPTLDPATGTFSKRMPPANGVQLYLDQLVPSLLFDEGQVDLVLDSATVTGRDGTDVQAVYHFRIVSPAATSRVVLPVTISGTNTMSSASWLGGGVDYDPVRVAEQLGAPERFGSVMTLSLQWPGAYFMTTRARGCVNHPEPFDPGSNCDNNGPRWFVGTAENTPNPNSSNPGRFHTGLGRLDFNNVGRLPGVRTLFEPRAYDDYSNTWREVEATLAPFVTAADYALYWGASGTIDSVIDLTHDVPVPFSTAIGLSWGVLNQGAVPGASGYDERPALTVSDVSCVEPVRTLEPDVLQCTGPAAHLARRALPGEVAFGSTGATVGDRTAPVAPGQGFVLYLKGHLFMIELEGGLPAAGTRWTLRDYVGAVNGGSGRSGPGGPYSFAGVKDYRHADGLRPFTAAGLAARIRYEVTRGGPAEGITTLVGVHPVPDPYYGPRLGEPADLAPEVRFVGLPEEATIRIYTTTGVLVRVLQHAGGEEESWNLRGRSGEAVASGVYFYHVADTRGRSRVGRMTVVFR